MVIGNIYGNGTTTATAGDNTIVHYYDKAGVKAANAISVYAQFADRRSMPLNMGKTYKVSKWLHIFDRATDHADFAAKGYLQSRSVAAITSGLPTLAEGAGVVNKVTISKVTIETAFARYGEMLDYTDEVTMFSEDIIQVHYREELGLLANRRAEDLIQLDMLATGTIQYVGTATALAEVGQDTTTIASDDDDSRVSYDMIRNMTKRLVRNRAQKNTSMVVGSTKIDTRTINKAYYCIIGSEIKFDLESLVRGTVAANGTTEYVYVPAYKYGAASNLAEGEVGACNDIRFIESESALVYEAAGAVVPQSYVGELGAGGGTDNTSATAGNRDNFDVFPMLFPTKGSFATVGLKGNGKIKFHAQSPAKIELDNPYGTNGFFSYNMWYAGIILREERLLKGLVCASGAVREDG